MHTPVVPGAVMCADADTDALVKRVNGMAARGIVKPDHDGKRQQPDHRSADVEGWDGACVCCHSRRPQDCPVAAFHHRQNKQPISEEGARTQSIATRVSEQQPPTRTHARTHNTHREMPRVRGMPRGVG